MTRPAVLETDPAVWRAEALDYIEARVRAGHQVTADDLRRDLPEPAHPNHVGQVFNILSSRGIIERTGWGTSTCRARKHGIRSVWVLHRQHRQPEPRRFKAGENLARLLNTRQTTRSPR